MKRACVLSVLLSACASSSPPIAAPVVALPVAPLAKPTRPAKEEIVETVLRSEKALMEDGDVDANLAIWTPDSFVVRARSASPGPYDVKVPIDRLRPTLRIIASKMERRKLEVDRVKVDVNGEEATLSWSAATTEQAKATDYFREVFRLRRERDGWRVVEKRYWPAARDEETGEHVKFGKSSFDEADRYVETMRAQGDERHVLYGLFAAYRFEEALAVARKISKDPSLADKWLWETLALCALVMGEAEEAAAAYARAGESP